MNNMGTQDLLNYAAKGAGAVVVMQVAVNFIPQIMANQFMAWEFYGITVGGVLAASIGVLAVEQLLSK